MTGRTRAPAALGVLILVLLGVVGSQARDPAIAQASRFDRAYTGFQAWFLGEQDERGTSWSHWRLQTGTDPPRRSSTEIDYLRVGQGPQRATVTSGRFDAPGLSLDVLHPPGSDTDLVLIGDRYRRPAAPGEAGPRGPLVTTPWIARPAIDASGSWSPCFSSATGIFCDLDRALARTRSVLPALPRWAQDHPDGARSAHTGIRLVDLLAVGNDPLDDRKLAQVVPLLHRLVPLTVTEDGLGRFVSVRLSGRLAAPGVQLDIDLGLEHSGSAVAADIPRGPRSPGEVTVMNELAYLRFARDAALRASTS